MLSSMKSSNFYLSNHVINILTQVTITFLRLTNAVCGIHSCHNRTKKVEQSTTLHFAHAGSKAVRG